MAFLISGGRSISLMYEWPLAIILHLRSTYKRWSWVFVATTFSECHQIRPDNSVESDFKAAQIALYLLLPAQWVQWSLVLHDGRAMVGSKKTPLQPCFAPCALQKSVKTLTIRSAHPLHRIKLCAAANITSRNIFFWRRWHFAKISVFSWYIWCLSRSSDISGNNRWFRYAEVSWFLRLFTNKVAWFSQFFYKLTQLSYFNSKRIHCIQDVFSSSSNYRFWISSASIPKQKSVILSVMIITSSHCA